MVGKNIVNDDVQTGDDFPSDTNKHNVVHPPLDTIFKSTSVGLAYLSLDGRFLEVNPGICHMTGYTDNDLLSMSLREITSPDYMKPSGEVIQKLVGGQSSVEYLEKVYLRKDGTTFWGRVSAMAVHDDHGKTNMLAAIIEDISVIKKVDLELQKKSNLLQTLFDYSPSIVMIVNSDGRVTKINKTGLEKLHKTDQEVLNMLGGQVLDCLNSFQSGGCGQTPECPGCPIRSRVIRTFETGLPINMEEGSIVVVHEHEKLNFEMLISTSLINDPDEPLVLVTLVDITHHKEIERALLNSEDKYRQLIEKSPVGIFLVKNGEYTFGNPAGAAMLGLTSEAVAGIKVLDTIHPDYIDLIMNRTSRIAVGGANPWTELVIRKPDGTAIETESISIPIQTEDGPMGLVICQDITDKKKAQNDYRQLFNALNDAYALHEIICDDAGNPVDYRFLEVNHQFEVFTGLQSSSVVGKTVREVMPDIEMSWIERYGIVAKTGRPDHFESYTQSLDRWFTTTAYSPKVNQFATVFIDVTERMKNEQILKEKQDQYKQMFANQSAIMLITDSEKDLVLEANPAAATYFGYSVEQMHGMQATPLFAVPPEEYFLMRSQAVSGEQDFFKLQSRLATGEVRDIEANAVPITLSGGKSVFSIITDVTERNQAQRGILSRTAMLEAVFKISKQVRAAQSRDQILRMVAEEIHQVVNCDAIQVNLLDNNQDTYQVSYADGILQSNMGRTLNAKEGIAPQFLESSGTIVLDDYAALPNRNRSVHNVDLVGPVVLVQLRSEFGLVGAMSISRVHQNPHGKFTPDEVQLLTAVGELVGNALRRAGLFDQAMDRMDRLNALHEIDEVITTNLDYEASFEKIIDKAFSLLKVDAVCLLVLQPDKKNLKMVSGVGFRTKWLDGGTLGVKGSIAGEAIFQKKVIHVDQFKELGSVNNQQGFLDEEFVGVHVAPMMVNDQTTGALEFFHRKPCNNDAEEIHFMEALASQAAIALHNSQLFDHLEQSNAELEAAYDATIRGWSYATDLRDKETEGHSLRVTAMAIKLAELIRVPSHEIIQLRRGGLLHDIGKIAIPDAVLLKPGPLNDAEWVLMKEHPNRAKEMLNSIEFLRAAMDIPYCHHEKFDGTGYPRGLSGYSIPLAARIFALIDVWDALRSDRPYRSAWDKEKTIAYIQSQTGKHFDPEICKVFLENLDMVTE